VSAPPAERAPEDARGEVERAFDDWFMARAPRKDSPNTIEAYARDLRTVLAEVARVLGVPPSEVGIDQLDKAMMRRAFGAWSETRGVATVRRGHSVWSGFFQYLVSEDRLPGSPMVGVAKPKAQRRLPKAFAEDDAARIVRAILDQAVDRRDPWPELDAAAVLTLITTGERLGELLGTNVGDVTRTAGSERIRVTGKGDAERAVPIQPALVNVLGAYLNSRRARFPSSARQRGVPADAGAWDWWTPDAPLFVDRRGERMRKGGLQYLVQKVYIAAGVDATRARGALVHALRHTAATRMAERGATGQQLMDFLGHRSLATTQGYLSATAHSVRAAAALNPAWEQLAPVEEVEQ
jgi:site-specific recombinase XerD